MSKITDFDLLRDSIKYNDTRYIQQIKDCCPAFSPKKPPAPPPPPVPPPPPPPPPPVKDHCPICADNLIVNGDFEDILIEGTCGGGGKVNGWTQSKIDVHGRFQCHSDVTDINHYIDLNQVSPGFIQQTVDTKTGRMYKLTFKVQANWNGLKTENREGIVFAKSVGGVGDRETGKGFLITPDTYGLDYWPPKKEEEMGWIDEEFVFQATSDQTQIKFISTSNTVAYGPVIDCVCLQEMDYSIGCMIDNWQEGSTCRLYDINSLDQGTIIGLTSGSIIQTKDGTSLCSLKISDDQLFGFVWTNVGLTHGAFQVGENIQVQNFAQNNDGIYKVEAVDYTGFNGDFVNLKVSCPDP